jgi:hypothetical protein
MGISGNFLTSLKKVGKNSLSLHLKTAQNESLSQKYPFTANNTK